MSDLLKRPAKPTAKVDNTSGLMAKPKTKDDDTVEDRGEKLILNGKLLVKIQNFC